MMKDLLLDQEPASVWWMLRQTIPGVLSHLQGDRGGGNHVQRRQVPQGVFQVHLLQSLVGGQEGRVPHDGQWLEMQELYQE